MKGSVLSFLKAERKVSDTGSAQVLPTNFGFIWLSIFKNFRNRPNQKQEFFVAAMLVYESGRNEQSL
jgi:hypothetical protein